MVQPTAAPARPSAPKPGGSQSPTLVLSAVLRRLVELKLADQSTYRMTELMTNFVGYVEKGHQVRRASEICEDHIEGFVFAPVVGSRSRRPSTATMHLRRSAVRLYFRIGRELALLEGDPSLDLVLSPRSSLAMRPLTNDEIVLGRTFSLHTLSATRQPAAWALAEATARTSEIPHIRVEDLDMDAGRVWIHGGGKTQPRWGLLTPWGRLQMERRLEVIQDGSHLVYEGDGSAESRQSSSCIAISETLVRAGLAKEPDVRPGSVAAWAGARVLSETGAIDQVALRLGVRSLDRAARLIAWDWAHPLTGENRSEKS